MPVEIQIDPDSGRAEGVASGDLTLDEMKSAVLRVWEHPDFRRTSMLWDLRQSRFSLSSEQIREFAEFAKTHSKLGPTGRTAFVVSGNVQFGLVRMFGAYREQEGMEIQVFRELDVAEDWVAGGTIG